MNIPDSCVSWIKLQRSGYKNLKKEFIEDMVKEYQLMNPFLPEKCESILDIGCGIGGIDVLLDKHYNHPKIYLFDSNFTSDKIVYGFSDKTSFYNDMLATKDMMILNNIKNYFFLNIKYGFEHLEHIDLIISLLSCGYYYSVEKYLYQIDKSLSYNGTLIIDIRQGTKQIEKVKEYFPKIDIISTYNKSNRICARRH